MYKVITVNIMFLTSICTHSGVDMDNDVITCPVPYGGMLLFNNLTPHRRLVIIMKIGIKKRLVFLLKNSEAIENNVEITSNEK